MKSMVTIDELVRICNDNVVSGLKVYNRGDLYDVYDVNIRDNKIILYTKRPNEQIMQDAIDDIMDNFNFDRVHSVMRHLNWTYYDDYVPNIDELKNHVMELIREAFEGFFEAYDNTEFDTYLSYCMESGGFKVEVGAMSNIEEPKATVSFILEQA